MPSGSSDERTSLILYGWTGSGPEHWQSWLAARLAERGRRVRYPALPQPDELQLSDWLAALDAELAAAPGEVDVLCHSLACFLWMHHAARRPGPVARVLLVAPPSPAWNEPTAASFLPPPFDVEALRGAADSTLLVWGDGDPYCPEGAAEAFPGLEMLHVPGGAHLNVEAGYGPWPWIEAWALGRT